MKDGKVLRFIYTLFIGVLLAVFVGAGINTFYPSPAAPVPSTELNTYGKELTPEQAAKQKAFDIQNEKYRESLKPYNRNVSIIALAAALVFLIISTIMHKRLKLIADGIMLGGLFTLLYSIGRGFASQNSVYVFVVVSIGLIIALYLGYRHFMPEHD